MRIAIVVAAIAAASCQSTTAADAAMQNRISAAQGAAVDRVCFTGNVEHWDALRRNVLLLEENKSWYMLSLGGTCDAAWAHARIAERASVEGEACLSSGDRVQSFELGGMNTCTVRSIHAWKE